MLFYLCNKQQQQATVEVRTAIAADTKRMHSFTNVADDDAGDYLRIQESFYPKFSYSQSVYINMTFEFHLNP